MPLHIKGSPALPPTPPPESPRMAKKGFPNRKVRDPGRRHLPDEFVGPPTEFVDPPYVEPANAPHSGLREQCKADLALFKRQLSGAAILQERYGLTIPQLWAWAYRSKAISEGPVPYLPSLKPPIFDAPKRPRAEVHPGPAYDSAARTVHASSPKPPKSEDDF